MEVELSYLAVLLLRRFSAGGGTAPFFIEPCFHDEDKDDGCDCCNCGWGFTTATFGGWWNSDMCGGGGNSSKSLGGGGK